MESPILVGILNVTPDSFSDGGSWSDANAAVAHGMQMLQEGASIIDIGGESTRPGAERVDAEEQLKRVIPVIEALHAQSEALISIDTTNADVAQAAMAAGASIINDVSSGEEDPTMLTLAAQSGAGLVLMHRRLPPELDQYSDAYEVPPESCDIVQDVIDWLMARVDAAIASGVGTQAIAIDPGLGFGKSVSQNWQIVQQVNRFVELGLPVYIGASRKSFIGAKPEILEPTRRDHASATAASGMSQKGAQIFRVHNIVEHVGVLQSHSLNHYST